MAEHADTDPLSGDIAAKTVESTVRLEEYLTAHALIAFAQATESWDAARQKEIVQTLAQSQDRNAPVRWHTRTDIWKLLKRKGYAKVSDMEKELKELADRGLLLTERVESRGAGRDTMRYGLNPRATEE